MLQFTGGSALLSTSWGGSWVSLPGPLSWAPQNLFPGEAGKSSTDSPRPQPLSCWLPLLSPGEGEDGSPTTLSSLGAG